MDVSDSVRVFSWGVSQLSGICHTVLVVSVEVRKSIYQYSYPRDFEQVSEGYRPSTGIIIQSMCSRMIVVVN